MNSHIELCARLGGVFAVFVFWHFIADWAFQTHAVAMSKSRDAKVRALHCLQYAVYFIPIAYWLGAPVCLRITSYLLLFVTHFVIDSYVPVAVWAKHLRRVPQFTKEANDEDAFKNFASTQLGQYFQSSSINFCTLLCCF